MRAQLQVFWGAERIFADIDSLIALVFLERYPSPTDARGLGEKRLEGFLEAQLLLRPALPRRAAREVAQRT